MAVRMCGMGSGEIIKYHDELIGSGKYPHDVLDKIVEEVVEGRGEYSSLDERFKEIIKDIGDNINIDKQLEQVWEKFDEVDNTFNEIINRIDLLEQMGPGGSCPGGGGAGTTIGSYIYYVYEAERDGITGVSMSEVGSFLKGRDELEVFRSGIRMIIDDDYTELNNTTVIFKDPLRKGEIVVLRVRDRLGLTKSRTRFSEYIILDKPTTKIRLNHKFQDGSGVEVFVNGVLYSPALDYVLIGQSTIEFKQELPMGCLINALISDTITDEEPVIIQQKFLTGKQKYNLTKFSYNTNMGELELYIEGVKQTLGVDYIETSSTEFELLHPHPDGLVILACKDNPGAIAGSHLHSYGVVPFGAVDGENSEFLLKHIPQKGSVLLYIGGIRQGVQSYEVQGNKITTSFPPPKGIDIFVDYVM